MGADGGVVGTVGDVVGGVVPTGGEKGPVGAGQVVDVGVPEECLTRVHALASLGINFCLYYNSRPGVGQGKRATKHSPANESPWRGNVHFL